MYSALALSLAAIAVAAPLSDVGKVPDVSSGSSSYSSGSGKSSGGKPPMQGTKYTATFDDLDTGLIGGAIDGVLGGGEIGPYQGLEYEGLVLASPGAGGLIPLGVNPESPPNVAAYGGAIPDLVGALLGDFSDTPLITTQFPGSANNVFDFTSFYFGCVTPGDFVADVATDCTVTVTAFRNAQEVASQDFTFDVDALDINADMKRARLSGDFKGIDTVRFETEGDGLLGVGLLTATYLDNLEYTVYKAYEPKKEGGKDYEKESKGYEQEGAKKNGTSSSW